MYKFLSKPLILNGAFLRYFYYFRLIRTKIAYKIHNSKLPV